MRISRKKFRTFFAIFVSRPRGEAGEGGRGGTGLYTCHKSTSREFLRKRSELFRPLSERRSCERLICLKNREWRVSYSGSLATFGSPRRH